MTLERRGKVVRASKQMKHQISLKQTQFDFEGVITDSSSASYSIYLMTNSGHYWLRKREAPRAATQRGVAPIFSVTPPQRWISQPHKGKERGVKGLQLSPTAAGAIEFQRSLYEKDWHIFSMPIINLENIQGVSY